MAACFLVLFYVVGTVASVIPVLGQLVSAAMFGSPFVLLVIALKGVSNPNATMLGLAMVGPYPLIGGLLGYFWPLAKTTKLVALRQIVVWFALTFVVLLAVGFCVAFYAAAADS
jgi:hypothetical protein